MRTAHLHQPYMLLQYPPDVTSGVGWILKWTRLKRSPVFSYQMVGGGGVTGTGRGLYSEVVRSNAP